MWDEDKYWFGLMLKGRNFNGEFYFDKQNSKVLKYFVEFKDRS